MIIVFDLDDTLYDEITFVKSGFKEVSNFLEDITKEKSNLIYSELINILKKQGRGKIFDDFLQKKNIFTKKLLLQCIKKYRYNQADLKPYQSAVKFLEKNKDKSIYLVTDGNKNVQAHKVKLLKLNKCFKKIFITHRYGIDKAKPSLYCFEKIKKIEKCRWDDLVYIGDNPLKDFVSLKKVNAKTIRLLKGNYSDTIVSEEYEAQSRIHSLDELSSEIKKLFK